MTQTHRINITDKRRKTRPSLLSALLTVFLLFSTTASVIAQTEFQGSLNSVSITDSAGTNSPPIANFTYTQNGESFTFNASGSSDSDGSITKYTWNFGNGTTSEGLSATYNFSEVAALKVTLTVVDNNNGVALSQKTVNSQKIITDDFSSDTLANYTPVSNALNISNGVATCAAWSSALAFHNTSTGGNDNYAQVDLTYSNANDFGGVVARWNPTNNTGYGVRLTGSSLKLYSHNGSSTTLLGSHTAIFSTNMTYTIKITVIGSAIKCYVNDIERIAVTNTLYSAGEYTGVIVSRGYGGITSLDNFIGGSL